MRGQVVCVVHWKRQQRGGATDQMVAPAHPERLSNIDQPLKEKPARSLDSKRRREGT